jgi:protein disulfide-isomerase A1
VFRNDGGDPTEYDAPRKANEITNFVKRLAEPPVSVLDNADDVQAFVDSKEVAVVGFFAADDDANAGVFATVGKDLRSDVRHGSVRGGSAKSVADEFGAKVPGIVAFRKFEGDEPTVAYDGDFGDKAALAKWVKQQSFPSVGLVGPENYQRYVERDLPMLWFFVDEADKQDTLAAARAASSAFSDQFSFVYLDGVKWMEHVKSFGLNGELPAVVLEDRDGGLNYIFSEGAAVAADGEELKQWLSRAVSGDLNASLKSEDVPADNTGDLTVVVGKNYDDVVLDVTKDVLVEFFAPWCSHCKALAPRYEALATKFHNDAHVVIAACDATLNDTPNRIEGFPSILFFAKHDKANPVAYDGPRDEKEMERWVRARLTPADTADAADAKGHDEL